MRQMHCDLISKEIILLTFDILYYWWPMIWNAIWVLFSIPIVDLISSRQMNKKSAFSFPSTLILRSWVHNLKKEDIERVVKKFKFSKCTKGNTCWPKKVDLVSWQLINEIEKHDFALNMQRQCGIFKLWALWNTKILLFYNHFFNQVIVERSTKATP